MPYTKRRLLEALQVVREDILFQNATEAAKLAKTQYRERHNLRTPNIVQSLPVHVWRNTDSSDDEFDPSQKKSRLKLGKGDKNVKRKRNVAAVSQNGHDPLPKKPKSSGERTDAVLAERYPYIAFLTLKYNTARGREILPEALYEHHNPKTSIDTSLSTQFELAEPSQWQSNSGGLHRVNRSVAQQEQDFHVAQAENSKKEESEVPRSSDCRQLRSGKIIAKNLSNKRKAPCDGIESDLDQDENATERIKHPRLEDDTEEISNNENEKNPIGHLSSTVNQAITTLATVSLGCSADDAISIVSISDSETGSNNTTPIKSQYSVISSKSTPHTTPPAQSTISPASHAPASSFAQSSLVRLTTSFSHPINLKSSFKCTFHSDYRHSILGHGAITGEYIVDNTKPGQLIETGDGHRARDIPPDSMCIPCALRYLQIIRCPGHRFIDHQPFTNIKKTTTDPRKAYTLDLFTRLAPGNPNRNTKALTETCRLCPAPATRRCSEPQLKDQMLRPCRLPGETMEAARTRIEAHPNGRASSIASNLPFSSPKPPSTNLPFLRTASQTQPNPKPEISIQDPIPGCGLMLCNDCHNLVQNKCQGRLQENRNLILTELKKRKMPPRADVEFLFREGLVGQAYNVGRRRD